MRSSALRCLMFFFLDASTSGINDHVCQIQINHHQTMYLICIGVRKPIFIILYPVWIGDWLKQTFLCSHLPLDVNVLLSWRFDLWHRWSWLSNSNQSPPNQSPPNYVPYLYWRTQTNLYYLVSSMNGGLIETNMYSSNITSTVSSWKIVSRPCVVVTDWWTPRQGWQQSTLTSVLLFLYFECSISPKFQ